MNFVWEVDDKRDIKLKLASGVSINRAKFLY